MKTTLSKQMFAITLLAAMAVVARPAVAATNDWTLVGWNNLGMHCLDRDFSVMSLLPPFNTFHAQLMDPSGKLITNSASYTVTFQAVADPDGSINKTSIGKDNFWQYVQQCYGVPLPADVGLAGVAMPGPLNAPQGMSFDPAFKWFVATGLPIVPVDDAGKTNAYPMVRLTAKNSAGQVLATTDIVLPVSDEMDCRACHSAGGALDPNPERDYRLSILQSHDALQSGSAVFTNALAQAGYDANGLYATAMGGTPILCAKCHASEALGTGGIAGCVPLTRAMHAFHANVTDPTNGLKLGASDNRSACYRCHPGSATRCLRGAMGSAVASDGSMAMQCQSCHGGMAKVGAADRIGWLHEPNCQNCHTGTATSNNGQIRYTSVFDANGNYRQAVNQTFATNPNTPAPGISLYRFSKGHGGLQCEACHGATHAEYPSSHRNDNIQSQQIQGHAGVIAECTACHTTQPRTISGGPHGMHPVGQSWVNSHGDAAEDGRAAQCRVCHGADYRGTVLSRTFADRTLYADDYGTKTFWRGFQVGCYTCHNGPNSESRNPNRPAVVQNASVATPAGTPANVTLAASDADRNTLTLRIVSQPAHGTVALNGNIATFFPDDGYNGKDSFTFAAWDGATDSNLGTVKLAVGNVPVLPSQPDAAIKASTEVLYTGVNVINADATGQTKSQTAARAQKRIFHIKVQNTGEDPNSFTVRGAAAASGFVVAYFKGTSGGPNITAAVLAGTYSIANLAPGASQVVRVEITPTRTARRGSVQTALVTATSARDTNKTDTVKAVVTVR